MNKIATTRSVDVIAAEINHIKQETRILVLNNSIEIGRRLVEAKSLVEHGQWSKWLKESVDYSQRTAQNLMRVFDEYGANQIDLFGSPKAQAFADLSYTKALALLAIPENEREKFVEDNKVDEMSTRQLQDVIKEKEKVEKEKEEALKLAEELKEKANRIEKEKAQLESDLDNKDQSLKLSKESIEKLQDTLEREREGAKQDMDKLKKSIKETKDKIKELKKAGNDEEIEKLREELNKKETEESNYMNKIQELEERLKEKPVDVEVVEKIPEEIEKELKQLREKQGLGEMANNFKIRFGMIQDNFNEIFKIISEMPEEIQVKYKGAIKVLINKMGERL